MAYVDWKLASIGVMLIMGIFNILARKFFERGGDWRIFIPLAAVACLALIAYFAMSYRDVKVTVDSAAFALALGVLAAATLGLTAAVYADNGAPLSVAMPIMGMSIVVTAVIAMFVFGEPVTPAKIAGIILGGTSIALLSLQ